MTIRHKGDTSKTGFKNKNFKEKTEQRHQHLHITEETESTDLVKLLNKSKRKPSQRKIRIHSCFNYYQKMFNLHQKIMRHSKKQECITHPQMKKQKQISQQNFSVWVQMFDLAD